MKKFGNVLCVILAWLLSIVLVVMLTVTPMTLSALSLLKSNTIAEVVIDVFMDLVEKEFRGDQDVAADYRVTKLAAVTGQSDSQDTSGIAGVLERYLGAPVSQETVEKVLSSNTVKEIVRAYSGDLTNVLTGEEKLSELDVQKIETIVNNNMDEVVQLVREIKPDTSEKTTEELKASINKVVEEKAEEIIQLLPKPEEIRQQMVENHPELEVALDIIARKNTIMWSLVGVIVLLCALIFVCRLSGFRGFRWLAVDMFVGGGINALISLVVLVETPVVLRMIPDSTLNSVISGVLHAFDLALFERAAIILAAGGVLLTAYILIKKARAKKASVNVEEA